MEITRIWFLVFVALIVVGCGSSVKVAPVSGAVTLDGKPLANAHIAFQPVAAAGKQNASVGSYGVTDASGKYSLRTVDMDQPGAVVGNHRVEINLMVENDDRDPKTRPPQKTLPTKYNRTTELQFTVVSGGSSTANFDLKSQ